MDERLRALLKERDAKFEQVLVLNAELHKQNEELRRQITLLRRELERLLRGRGAVPTLDPAQGKLFAMELPQAVEAPEPLPPFLNEAPDGETADDPIKARYKPKERAKKIDISALPRRTVIHELPLAERTCKVTGLTLVPVGEKVFEEIDYTPSKLSVIEHRRTIYGPPQDVAGERKIEPKTAPLPERPLPEVSASAGLLAQVLVQKYEFHLPLYRQEELFAQSGLKIPRQTLCDWVMSCAEALEPIANELLRRIQAGPVLGLDDTHLKCRGEKGSGYFQAYLWTFCNPKVAGVAFRFTEGRSALDLQAQLQDVTARFLIGDGYAGNRAAAREAGLDVIHGGCWAHVLRGFRDAEKNVSKLARLFLDDIGSLYDIEADADRDHLPPEERLLLRRARARPVLARLYRRTLGFKRIFSKKDGLGEAIAYLRNHRRALKCFLESGDVPLDNNACERAIRPVALGRKNFLFAGSPRGGRAAATMYTLIASCRIAGVDRFEYLSDALVRIRTHPKDQIGDLLPSDWRPPDQQFRG